MVKLVSRGELFIKKQWLSYILVLSIPTLIVTLIFSRNNNESKPQLETVTGYKEEKTNLDLMNPLWEQDDKSIELDERKYIIHDGFYYVPIDEEVNESQLDTILGTVTRIGEWEDMREGDTVQYIPGTKYYSIKGIKDKDKIAIEILWHTIYEHKILKYQVMEREKPISETPQHGG